MESADNIDSNQNLLRRIRYPWNGEQRQRCYRIMDGEPALVDCPDVIGIGDAVAAATSKVGIKPCGSCKRRQEALNAVTPSWARRLLGRLFRR